MRNSVFVFILSIALGACSAPNSEVDVPDQSEVDLIQTVTLSSP